MNMRLIDIHKLNMAEYNPRKDLQPGDPKYEKLKRSIEEFGIVEPIVWNENTGNVVGGHQRLKVMKELGHKDADCVVVELDEGYADVILSRWEEMTGKKAELVNNLLD